MSTAEIIDLMVQEIVTRFHPERIILFGSQAREDARPDSDVDLMVVMPDDTNRRKASIEILVALAKMPMPKDVIVTTPHEIATRGHLKATILNVAIAEGREIYAR